MGLLEEPWHGLRSVSRAGNAKQQEQRSSFVAASVLRPIAAGAPASWLRRKMRGKSSEDKQRRTWLGTYFFWKSEKEKIKTFQFVQSVQTPYPTLKHVTH